MSRSRCAFVVCLAVALSTLLLIGGYAPGVAAKEQVLKIATVNPLSGPVALWGVSQRRCAEMWMEEINAKGGLLVGDVRYKIELPRYDTEGLPDKARTCTERAIHRDKVKFIIGPNIDTTSTAVGQVCNPMKVIHLQATFDPANVSPDRPYSILNMWMGHQTARIMYRYLIEKYGIKKIAFFTKDESGCRSALEISIKIAKNLGLEVTGTTFYPHGVTDMYPQATKLLAGKPDAIDSPYASPEEMGLFCKAVRELGFTGVLSQETEGDPEVTCGIAGEENAEGILFNAGAYDPANASPKMQEYHDKYVEKFGVWNPDAATKLYAAYMLGAAIQKAGTIDDTDAVMAAFHTMQLKTPYLPGDEVVRAVGKKEFGINNQIGAPLCIAQITNGESVVIKVVLGDIETDIQYVEPYEFQW